MFSPAVPFLGTCEGAFCFLGRRGEDVCDAFRDLKSTGSPEVHLGDVLTAGTVAQSEQV